MEIAMPIRKSTREHPPVALRLPAAVLSLFSLSPSAHASPESQTLAPVVVTATRQEIRASEALADVTVIEREEIERAGQGTIADLLSRQAGVQIVQTGGPGTSASFYLRGANSNQTKVLIDGISINSMDGSGSPLRYFPLDDIERIEILRGPASTLYGADALGGVINIITRRGQPGLRGNAFAGYGSHNTSRVSAGLSGGNERWRFRLDAHNFRTDGFSSRRDATNRDADKDAYRNAGGAVSLSFLPAKDHEIGTSYRQNDGLSHFDSANTPADGNYDYRVRFRVRQWQLFSKNRFLPNWTSTLQYGGSEDYQKNYSWDDWAFPPREDISFSHTRNKQLSWQNDIDLPLGKALLMVERSGQKAKAHGAAYQDKPEIDNTSLMAGWTAHTGRHYWQMNIRHDGHSEFSGKTTYGASYGYQLLDTLRIHAGYGTAFRAPNVYELFVSVPAWWFQGNPDLKPEESRNSEVGLTWERGTERASVIYYHNRVKNLISGTGIAASGFYTYENVNKALLEGVTLSWRGTLDAWQFSADYDWLNAQNRSKDPSGAGFERLGRRARHKATFGVNYARGNLDVGVEQVLASRRYDMNYRKTDPNREELGGYGLTNLIARYAISRDFSLEGRIDNLFNKKYEHARGYNTDGFNAFIGLRYSLR
jgi:vitamin B12 transporter